MVRGKGERREDAAVSFVPGRSNTIRGWMDEMLLTAVRSGADRD